MKTQFQTLSFLSECTPKTALDAEFINSFLKQRFNIAPRTLRNASNFDGTPLDVQSFILWFDRGHSPLKIARFGNRTVMLGKCRPGECDIIGTEEGGKVALAAMTVRSDEICEATEDEREAFGSALLLSGLQPDPGSLRLVPRYVPGTGHRVIFYDYSLDVQGVGVVRSVAEDGNVTFFCYFAYPTPTREKRLGYSLREDPGYDLRFMAFENIDRENAQSTLGNTTSCFRRLGRELERAGKVWKDKLLRIEPLCPMAEKGQPYYYISDKLKVVSGKEKGTPTSRHRYLAGNYFLSHMAASQALGKINETLRDYLASDCWPDFEKR